MSDLTIAGLARAGGVGVETIRYYQRRGLLEVPACSRMSGHGGAARRYGEDHLRRLRFIRSGQAAGFTLSEIAELIALDSTEDRARAHAMATRRLAALDAKITELQQIRGSLARLAESCGSGSSGPCPILTAFDGD